MAYVQQVQRYIYPVDLTGSTEALDIICVKLGISKAEAIREALDNYSNQVKGMKVIEIRKLSQKQGQKEILDYVKKHKGAYTSEIADGLRLDVMFVNETLTKLAERGKVK